MIFILNNRNYHWKLILFHTVTRSSISTILAWWMENYFIMRSWHHQSLGISASSTCSSLPNPLSQWHWAENYSKTPQCQIPQGCPAFHNTHHWAVGEDRDGTQRAQTCECVLIRVHKSTQKHRYAVIQWLNSHKVSPAQKYRQSIIIFLYMESHFRRLDGI